MTVTIQQTPNPNAHKFILPFKAFAKPLNISTAEAAAVDPLAEKLFALAQVYNVFMVQDFVTVNKLPEAEWDQLDQHVRQILNEHFGLGDT